MSNVITLNGHPQKPMPMAHYETVAAYGETGPVAVSLLRRLDVPAGPKAKSDLDAPDQPSRRWGLPIWGVKKIEPWWVVAGHCLQLDHAVPKAFGGKSLTKADKDRLQTVQGHGPVTNADAEWIEGVVTRCHAAREAWRTRDTRTAA